jgi:hypothetical protein
MIFNQKCVWQCQGPPIQISFVYHHHTVRSSTMSCQQEQKKINFPIIHSIHIFFCMVLKYNLCRPLYFVYWFIYLESFSSFFLYKHNKSIDRLN